MLRLRKYLKPYAGSIVLAITLLFVQANADLALPDYLSKIVNNGIQQNGVENAVPEALRESEWERLALVLSEEEQGQVLDDYTLVEPGSPASADHAEKYPVIADQPVYVRRDLSSAEIEALNPILGKAFMAVAAIEQLTANPEQAQAMADRLGIDLTQLPANVDPFQLLSSLPADRRAAISTGITDQLASLGDSMVNQMAVGAVRSEYEALGVDTEQLQTSYILRTGGLMLLISLIGGACTIAVGFLASRTAAGAARDIRLAAFKQVESFSSAEFEKFSTASLITRSTNDITQIQMVTFMIIRMVFYAPIIGIGGVIRAIDKSANMWWIIALAVMVLLGLILTAFSISLPKFRLMQDLVDRLNLVVRENLSGMMVVRAFNRQAHEEQRFDGANQDLADTSLFVARVMVTMMPAMMLLMNLLSVGIIWVGAHQVAEATIQVGDMIAFMQYAIQIVFAFLMMSMMFIFLPRAAVSGGRIADVLETESSIQDPPDPVHLPASFTPEIEFRDVSFRYPGAQDDVLHNITFTARQGETTAFIGSTGCGKSTVINLIPRFYDATAGGVFIGGVDVRDLPQTELRDKVGYVPQKGTLFSGTIASNLRYADESASDEELAQAASIAQAVEFIEEKPEGYEATIAQGGGNVSGGQKQRLAIARALVKQPPIYIFDDSFSALDFKTDSALRRGLSQQTGDSTVLIVTQRVATVMTSDQIIVLDEGRIVGKGTHYELMDECETYQQIAQSQLSAEELA